MFQKFNELPKGVKAVIGWFIIIILVAVFLLCIKPTRNYSEDYSLQVTQELKKVHQCDTIKYMELLDLVDTLVDGRWITTQPVQYAYYNEDSALVIDTKYIKLKKRPFRYGFNGFYEDVAIGK